MCAMIRRRVSGDKKATTKKKQHDSCGKWGKERNVFLFLQIRIGLNHVVEKANKILVDRHFLIGVEDRGQLSCHKTVVRGEQRNR